MSEPTNIDSPEVDRGTRKPPRRGFNGFMLIAIAMFMVYLINYRPDVETVVCDEESLAEDPVVIMLGTWWCPYCAEARRYFTEENISYCEYDIEKTETGKQMYEDVNGRGIPVLIVGDKYKINGYDRQAIDTALELLDYEPGT